MDPVDPTNRLVFAISGVVIKTHTNLYSKKRTQTYHDSDLVEYFDLKTNSWNVFNATLCIPRHSAAACELNGFIYVVGGHKIELPNAYIHSVERCSVNAKQSSFDLINIDYERETIRARNVLCMSLPEDNGIIILSHHQDFDNVNQGFFLDINRKRVKKSRFNHRVGAITSWQNSKGTFKNMTAYLTEEL